MSFDLTDYESRRRQDPKNKVYHRVYRQTEKYKEIKREYHSSSKYKEMDKKRRETTERKKWMKEYNKKKKYELSGVGTLEDFFG